MTTDVRERCLEQVRREHALLDRLEELLRELRRSLMRGKEGVPLALVLQAELAEEAAKATEQRLRWRIEMAGLLHLEPQRVSLGWLASQAAPESRQELLAARDALRSRVQEVAQVKQAAVSLLRAYVVALQRFFLNATGGGESAGCYGRGGASRAPAFGSIVTVRG